MRRKNLFLAALLLLWFSIYANAQHCPFDGSHIVVIKLMNNRGKPISKLNGSVYLKEINNANPQKCSYADKPLSIRFGTIQNSLYNKYEGSWQSWAKQQSEGCSFLGAGYYAVVLNQAQNDCMILQENTNDYQYISREFEIVLKQNGIEKKLAPVSNHEVYSLCTGSGSWQRINAIELTLK